MEDTEVFWVDASQLLHRVAGEEEGTVVLNTPKEVWIVVLETREASSGDIEEGDEVAGEGHCRLCKASEKVCIREAAGNG